jgi:hypothetical protein
MESARTSMLGERLRLSGGTLAGARASCLLTVLGALLMPFMSHDLQKKEAMRGEIMIGMLDSKR